MKSITAILLLTLSKRKKNSFALGEIFDAPELFDAYSDISHRYGKKNYHFGIRSLRVHFKDTGMTSGRFNPRNFSISIDSSLRQNPNQLRLTLIHEIQHAVQDIEGFATGGSPKDFAPIITDEEYSRRMDALRAERDELDRKMGYSAFGENTTERYLNGELSLEEVKQEHEHFLMTSPYGRQYRKITREINNLIDKHNDRKRKYSRLGGEIEARNAEARANLTPEQRRNTLLADTQDSSDWIIRDKLGNIRTESEQYNQSANDDISSVSDIPAEQIKAVRKKYKGTSMWMKAPNGKKSNLTQKQWLQVRTPNFKAWFGDWENDPDNSSQVVDENGEPLVLYHRTQRGNNFSVFRKNSGGIHFGTRRQADDRAKGRLFPVFLNVRNPFRMYDQGAHWNFSNNWTEKTGNDGIVYLNEVEGIEPGTPPQNSWIVFEPNQIKSATKNNGYFDANNPDIYKQTATINNNSLDSNNTVRSVYDFLTPEAQRQAANIKKKYQNTTNWMKAPNGKKSNLNELQWLLVRTDNFKRWFGDWQNNPQEASKVLDANGEPLLVTHQTGGGGFSKFNTTGKFSIYSYKTRGTGAWFADLKDNEPLYSNDKEGENIYHVFLNIRNPFIYDAEGRHWEDIGRIWIADEEGGEPIYYDNDGKPFLYDYQAREYIRTVLRSNPRYYYEHDNRYPTTDDLVRAVRKGRLGNGNHDGVIIRNVGDLGYDNIDDYVIFKPIQVKARDNNCAFSLKNTEIYKQSASDRDIDKQYFDALNSGDMDTARSIVDEQARKKGYYADNEHRGQHQPATSQDGYPNLANVMNSDLVPADYWTHPQYYLYSPEEWDAFYAVTHAIRNKKLLTVYRAVPDDVKETALRNGNWVTAT